MRSTLRAGELALFGLLVPVSVALLGPRLFGWVIPLLLLGLILVCWALRRDDAFPWGDAWRWRSWGGQLPAMLLRCAIGGVALAWIAWCWLPESFLRLPREQTGRWLLVLIGYPVLSVWPQEFLFRAAFVHRYRGLLGDGLGLLLANAVVFAAWHLLFGNWVAPLLTFLGSMLFLRTYQRTASVPAACVEHALWGGLLFTLGYGVFLHGGSSAMFGAGG